ncbi:MAG: DUF4397 domain-containing protein [Mucilaginibacter sp.]
MTVKVLIVVLAVAGLFSSCKKSGDLAPAQILTTNLNVVNADANFLNVYQNGTRIFNTSSISPGSQTNYMTVLAGTQTYQFKIAGTTTPNYIIDNYQLKLDTGKSYTLFAAGETVDKLIVTNDLLPKFSGTTGSYKAQLRYVNASPGTTNLTVTVRDSLSFTNSAFKYASGFMFTGIGTSNIKVYQAGSTTPVFTGVATLVPGIYYTLVTKGTLTGTGGNQLSVMLLIKQ